MMSSVSSGGGHSVAAREGAAMGAALLERGVSSLLLSWGVARRSSWDQNSAELDGHAARACFAALIMRSLAGSAEEENRTHECGRRGCQARRGDGRRRSGPAESGRKRVV